MTTRYVTVGAVAPPESCGEMDIDSDEVYLRVAPDPNGSAIVPDFEVPDGGTDVVSGADRGDGTDERNDQDDEKHAECDAGVSAARIVDGDAGLETDGSGGHVGSSVGVVLSASADAGCCFDGGRAVTDPRTDDRSRVTLRPRYPSPAGESGTTATLIPSEQRSKS